MANQSAPSVEELQGDPDFMSGSPADQHAYLTAVDPEYAKANAAERRGYLEHVLNGASSSYAEQAPANPDSTPAQRVAYMKYLIAHPEAMEEDLPVGPTLKATAKSGLGRINSTPSSSAQRNDEDDLISTDEPRLGSALSKSNGMLGSAVRAPQETDLVPAQDTPSKSGAFGIITTAAQKPMPSPADLIPSAIPKRTDDLIPAAFTPRSKPAPKGGLGTAFTPSTLNLGVDTPEQKSNATNAAARAEMFQDIAAHQQASQQPAGVRGKLSDETVQAMKDAGLSPHQIEVIESVGMGDDAVLTMLKSVRPTGGFGSAFRGEAPGEPRAPAPVPKQLLSDRLGASLGIGAETLRELRGTRTEQQLVAYLSKLSRKDITSLARK